MLGQLPWAWEAAEDAITAEVVAAGRTLCAFVVRVCDANHVLRHLAALPTPLLRVLIDEYIDSWTGAVESALLRDDSMADYTVAALGFCVTSSRDARVARVLVQRSIVANVLTSGWKKLSAITSREARNTIRSLSVEVAINLLEAAPIEVRTALQEAGCVHDAQGEEPPWQRVRTEAIPTPLGMETLLSLALERAWGIVSEIALGGHT